MAAAVGDFRAADPTTSKIKRTTSGLTLDLVPNPDILAGLAAARRPGQMLVGFALETDDPETAGRKKLESKGVDLIVVNTPAAIGNESNTVTLIDSGDSVERLAEMSKAEVARRILDRVPRFRHTAEDSHVQTDV